MMSDDEIRERVQQVMIDEFELEGDALRPEATLYDDLGLDSLDAVDMVVALEKAFAVKLANQEEVRSVRTMGDVVALIVRLQAEMVAGGNGQG
jgi:acyl carrier protein